MGIQIIHDSEGKNAGVFIPYNDWEELKRQHKDLQILEKKTSADKSKIFKNLKKGLKEVQLFKQGKLKTTPAKDFLNEL